MATVLKKGPHVDHLLLLDIGFREKIDLSNKIKALGDKFIHIKNIVEETNLPWHDEHLNLLNVEELFGNSAEKIAECIISRFSTGKPSNNR